MATATLSLGAAVCWGVAGFLAGLETRRLGLATTVLATQATAFTALVVTAAAAAETVPPMRSVAICALAGLASIIAVAALYMSLAIGRMTLAAPIAALGVVLPTVVGLASGDRPSTAQIAGIATIVVGIPTALRGASTDAEARSGDSKQARKSLGMAFVAAAGFGFVMVAVDAVAHSGVFTTLAIVRGVSFGAVALLLIAASHRELLPRRREVPGLVVIGLLEAAAIALFSSATTTGLLSIAAVLASLYPVVTVILARLILSERLRPAQAGGVALTLIGIALITAP